MVYLDDIIIYNSGGANQQIQRIKSGFDRLRDANIKLKPKKCSFLLPEVKYLRHIISRKGGSDKNVSYSQKCQ